MLEKLYYPTSSTTFATSCIAKCLQPPGQKLEFGCFAIPAASETSVLDLVTALLAGQDEKTEVVTSTHKGTDAPTSLLQEIRE